MGEKIYSVPNHLPHFLANNLLKLKLVLLIKFYRPFLNNDDKTVLEIDHLSLTLSGIFSKVSNCRIAEKSDNNTFDFMKALCSKKFFKKSEMEILFYKSNKKMKYKNEIK